jgi:DnaK suppressor protein
MDVEGSTSTCPNRRMRIVHAIKETPMPTRQQIIIRERHKLIDEQKRIIGELERLREALKVEVDVDAEEGDPDLIEREKNVALVNQLEVKQGRVNAALRSMEKGKYGICERCGIEIPTERLDVRPDTTLCVTCQAEVEKLIKRGQTPRPIQEIQ